MKEHGSPLLFTIHGNFPWDNNKGDTYDSGFTPSVMVNFIQLELENLECILQAVSKLLVYTCKVLNSVHTCLFTVPCRPTECL